MEARNMIIVVAILLFLLPAKVYAQSQAEYGYRVPTKDGKCLSPVASNQLWSDERDHVNRGSVLAWDIASSIGSPIMAMCDGVVITKSNRNEGGYGEWWMIKYDGGFSAIHAHCGWGTSNKSLKIGSRVTMWTPLCLVGMSGSTSGPHTHLEIHKAGGGRYRIDDFFDRRLMAYCKFCNSKNDPKAPIYSGGLVVNQSGQPAAQPAAVARPVAATQPLASISLNAVGLSLLIIAIFLLHWAFTGRSRGILRDAAAAAVILTMPVWLPMMFLQMSAATPSAVSAPAAVAPAAVPGSPVPAGASWKLAYNFMRKWEGNRCVHDPVRTLKGITQNTYSLWLKSKGYGTADVCTSLTDAQAEAIYYERYWLASGADKLPPTIAIAHFDHAVNTGVSAANKLLAQCGTDANCYVRARYADYRTKGNFRTYGRAWFNRVDDMIKYINDLVKKGS